MGEYLPLFGLAVVYFGLSFAMQRVINRLPLICSLLWTFYAPWGICWVIVGYGIARPYFWPESSFWADIGRMAFTFCLAWPGQWVANRNQLRLLLEIFAKFNVTKETTGVTIYFHELYNEPFNKNEPDSRPDDPFGCFDNHLAATRKYSNHYRKRHRI